jgi:hypothetical protein
MTAPATRSLRERIPAPLRRMLSSCVAGALALFSTSVIAHGDLLWSIGFGFFIASVFFIAQELLDVYRGLVALKAAQEATAAATEALLNQRFAEAGEANRLYTAIGESVVSAAAIRNLVDGLKAIRSRPALIQTLAMAEFNQLAVLIKELSEGAQADYEGEDRDWLLTLANAQVRTIDAISIVTIEASQVLIDGGPLRSDRAQRYFDAQIAGLQREDPEVEVRVRRIFVVEHRDIRTRPEFADLLKAQVDAGIDARVWDLSTGYGREYGDSSELVLFDGVACYLPSPAARTSHGERPVLINTRLEIDPERVRRRAQHFERLWRALSGSASTAAVGSDAWIDGQLSRHDLPRSR